MRNELDQLSASSRASLIYLSSLCSTFSNDSDFFCYLPAKSDYKRVELSKTNGISFGVIVDVIAISSAVH